MICSFVLNKSAGWWMFITGGAGVPAVIVDLAGLLFVVCCGLLRIRRDHGRTPSARFGTNVYEGRAADHTHHEEDRNRADSTTLVADTEVHLDGLGSERGARTVDLNFCGNPEIGAVE